MSIRVLYDAECRFCRAALGGILAWDRGGRIESMPLQDPEAAALLGGMSEAERLQSLRVVDADGRVSSGGQALPVLFDALPGGRPFAWLARRVQPLTDRGYELVDDQRPALTKLLPDRVVRAADEKIAKRS